MSVSQQLVKCPKCPSSVRLDRLKSHLQKVHHNQKAAIQGNKDTPKKSNSLTPKRFEQVASFIASWLKRKKDYLYNSNNIKILTIMAFENSLGYSFDEINKLYDGKINRAHYKANTKPLKITYEQMMDHLHQTLSHYSKQYIDQNIREQSYFKDDDLDDYADWYTCNSVDRMDGSKYLGYQRREYEDTRFGSFPVHDDYGDESWQTIIPGNKFCY